MNIKKAIFNITLLLSTLLYLNTAEAQTLLNVKHYTIDNGLPHNVGFDLLQDSKGYLWIGTDDGLARFDGSKFKVYRTSDGLLSNYPITMAEDKDGRLWVGSWKGGVNYLKNDSVFTPSIDYPLFKVSYIDINDDKLLLSDRVGFLFPYTRSANQWKYDNPPNKQTLYYNKDSLITYGYNPSQKKHPRLVKNFRSHLTSDKSVLIFGDFSGIWEFKNDTTFIPFRPEIIKQDSIHSVFEDRNKKLWLGSKGKIITIDSTGKASIINKGLPNKGIFDIEITSQGKIYFLTGTFDIKHRGFYSYDPTTNTLTDLKKALGLEVLPAYIEADKEDNIWLSTNGDGVYCIPFYPFKTYGKQKGLSNLFVNDVQEDKNGDIYIGTLNGLFRYNDTVFVRPKLFEDNVSSEISDLGLDEQKNLLVSITTQESSGNHAFMLKIKNKKIIKNPRGYSSSRLYTDSQNRTFFFQTYGKIGWKSHKTAPLNFWNYYESHKGLLIKKFFEYAGKHWIATNRGLISFKVSKMPQQKETLQFLDTLSIANGLISNHINAVKKVSDTELWIGTKEGLCNLKDGKWTCFNTKNGLIANNCTSLALDAHGLLWIGTPKGLSYFDGKKFTNYNHKTGLIASDVSCLFLDSKQRLWIGSSKGISALDLSNLPQKNAPPDLYIEKIEFNGISKPLSSSLSLAYNSNLKIYFRALTYAYPEGTRYQYRLNQGKWINTTSSFVEYGVFRSGAYTFEVRAKKFNSEWSLPKVISFEVIPPFWMTWWAIMGYCLGLVLVVYSIVRWRSKKLEKEKIKLEQLVIKRTYELAQQKEEIASQAEKLKEMDKMKSHFFSNISHEFRTPLTLIIGPAEKLQNSVQDASAKVQSQSILINAKRLLKLINQLLDFSKLESGKMVIQPKTQKINIFLKNIIHSFELLAQQKNINLKFTAPNEDILYEFDHDKLEKVFFNLLSNAFKFTPEGGLISIDLIRQGKNLDILLSDTGIGISEKSIPFIFDRFYQADSSQTRAHEGTGIGLSLVKEFIELHGGSIKANSKLNKGTSFLIRLPISENKEQPISALPVANPNAPKEPSPRAETSDITKKIISQNNAAKNTVLIVEDNEELRKFVCAELVSTYNVIEAVDGSEGIAKAIELVPDLIISDVMMPKTDGFELLSTLKNNTNTSHVPIIILSAKASFESKITGLETGGDDYLTKPFSPRELLLRIRNMLDRRDKLRNIFMQSISKPDIAIEPSQITVTSMDESFLKKAIEIVETHIMTPQFDVSFFSREMGMSPSGLFKKLKALTSLSTTEFIRSIKLKRAASLIQQKSGRIDEIAFQAGFNDISYFNRCFKKQFGVTPKKYQ